MAATSFATEAEPVPMGMRQISAVHWEGRDRDLKSGTGGMILNIWYVRDKYHCGLVMIRLLVRLGNEF